MKMTEPHSVLSIGSIITSHTLISRKYKNKKNSAVKLPKQSIMGSKYELEMIPFV
jgi:hypothetical protein